MPNSFYRYIRPVKFDEKRLELNTMPTGGICFRFDENKSAGLTFSFARCAFGDHFNKDVARAIADRRMDALMSDDRLWCIASVPYSDKVDVLVPSVIQRCEQWYPATETHFLVAHYMALEWKGLAQQLRKLVVHNQREHEKAAAFITANKALELSEVYAKMMARPKNA